MAEYIHINQINEVMNCNKSENKNLYVGLCGTQYVGSDRYAYVITEVISSKAVRVSRMHEIDYQMNRHNDENGNEFISDMSKYVRLNDDRTKIVPIGKVFKFRKNHRWIEEGYNMWSTGAVHFGEADEYRDPSF